MGKYERETILFKSKPKKCFTQNRNLQSTLVLLYVNYKEDQTFSAKLPALHSMCSKPKDPRESVLH